MALLAHLPDPDVEDGAPEEDEMEEIDVDDPDLDWSEGDEADANLEEMDP